MRRTAGRAIWIALALVLLAAEIVRPTTIPHKRLAHPSLARAGSLLPLDREQLDDLPPILQPAIGNIDMARAIGRGATPPLVSVVVLRGNGSVEVAGWCADPEAMGPGAGLVAIVDGAHRIDVSDGYGGERLDVVRVFHHPSLARVGFDVRIGAAKIGPGQHGLRFAVVARDGRGIFTFPTVVRVAVAR